METLNCAIHVAWRGSVSVSWAQLSPLSPKGVLPRELTWTRTSQAIP